MSENAKYRIIVTGGSGLVGNAIKEISHNYNTYEFIFLSSKDINLLDYNNTYNCIEKLIKRNDRGEVITGIIHLAANVGGLFKNLHNNAIMFEDNMLININLLKVANIHNIQRIISVLSTCIFPNIVSYPIKEEMLHNGAPHDSNCGYSYSKRMLETQSKLYQRDFGRDYICVIPTNIYGTHDNFNLDDSHVIPALIHKCYLNKMSNTPFVVMGSGKPLRQFIFSIDLAKLIMWSFIEYKERDNIILSVGENEEVSIGEVARLIAEKMDYESQLVFDTSKSDGQFKKSVSNDKLMTLYKDFQFTPISQGLDHTINWFLHNYPNIRK
jgi:GDP-L-fucose synthase